MSHFDELPSLKRKKPAPARDAPTPPVPSKPPFEFNGPEDTPEGVRYQPKADGFVATAPARSILLALCFGAFAAFLAHLLLDYGAEPDTPASFIYTILAGFSVLSFLTLKFMFGRTRIRVSQDRLQFGNMLFGLWIPRRLSLSTLERIRILNLSRSGGWIYPGIGTGFYNRAPSAVTSGTAGHHACEMETHDCIHTFGKNLREQHLYYFRHLIIGAAKERRSPKGQNLRLH